MRRIHNFRFSESEIFVRGEATTQISLNQLTKLDFRRARFGAVGGRVRDVNATESIKLICPTRQINRRNSAAQTFHFLFFHLPVERSAPARANARR
jgi:hypothetical protein